MKNIIESKNEIASALRKEIEIHKDYMNLVEKIENSKNSSGVRGNT